MVLLNMSSLAYCLDEEMLHKEKAKTWKERSPSMSFFAAIVLLAASLLSAAQSQYNWQNLPEKIKLPNGLPIIYQQDDSSAITSIMFLFKGGKAAEPAGKDGLSYLTTRLMVEIPDSSKIQNLMNQATQISLTSRGDYSLISLTCLSENFEEALKLVTSILKDPLFSGIRIDRIQEMMLHQREAMDDQPVNAAHHVLLSSLFDNSPYAGSPYGSKESLKAIKKKDIENFYRSIFRTGGMTAVVSTDLDKAVILDMVQKYSKDFPSEGMEALPPAFTPSLPEEKTVFLDKDVTQSLVSISFPLPETTSKNYILASLLDNFLGKGPHSKLWFLRTKEKLAYNVNSRTTLMKWGGILTAYLETDNTKRETAKGALRGLFLDVFKNGMTEEDLQMTKANTKAFFLREIETKEERIFKLTELEALGLGFESMNSFFQEVDAVSLEESNRYIKEILNPERSFEVVIGPSEKGPSS